MNYSAVGTPAARVASESAEPTPPHHNSSRDHRNGPTDQTRPNQTSSVSFVAWLVATYQANRISYAYPHEHD